MSDKTLYVAMVEADAGITVEANNEAEAKEKLENVSTGVLGPATVGPVEEFHDE
jgi:hypothetical protein